jgi:hypothetical protein
LRESFEPTSSMFPRVPIVSMRLAAQRGFLRRGYMKDVCMEPFDAIGGGKT